MASANVSGKYPVSGGAQLDMKKFPTIADYLRAKHSKLYDVVVDSLSMGNILTPRHRGSITFIIPSKKTIEKLEKLAVEDGNGPEEATDILCAHTIPGLLTSTADFSKYKDDIPNLLDKRIVVKNVGKDSVEIEGGTIKIDTAFKPFSRVGAMVRDNMAVWVMVDGEVEYKKAPDTTGNFAKEMSKAGRAAKNAKTVGSGQKRHYKVGGCEISSAEKALHELARSIRTSAAIRAHEDGQNGTPRNPFEPFVQAVVRILDGFERKKLMDEWNIARCLLTKVSIIDFTLLFYCRPMFSAESVLAAFNGGVAAGDVASAYDNFFKKPCEGCCMKDAAGMSRIMSVRNEKLTSLLAIGNKTVYTKIIALYDTLEKKNTLGTIKDVYPSAVHRLLENNVGLKLQLDEAVQTAAISISMYIKNAMSPVEKIRAANDIITSITLIFRDFRKYVGMLRNCETFNMFDDAYSTEIAVAFLKGTALHFPSDMPAARLISGQGENGEDDEYEGSDEMPEPELIKGAYEEMNKSEEVPVEMSEQAMAELRAYHEKYGKMPEL